MLYVRYNITGHNINITRANQLIYAIKVFIIHIDTNTALYAKILKLIDNNIFNNNISKNL